MANTEDSIRLYFPVLDYVNDIRYKHGIKLEEYGRYRKYCSKKLHIIRRKLRTTNIKPGKYIHEEFPVVINDTRYFEILTIRVERSWTYAMELKSKIEATSSRNKGRHHYMRRLGKAYRISIKLEDLSLEFGDNTTVNNSKIYRKYIEGVLKFELEQFEDAHSLLTAYSTVLDQKIRSTQGLISEGYSLQLNHVNSMLKLCTFHMRVIGKSITTRTINYEEDYDAELISIRTLDNGDVNVYCRGTEIPITSKMLLEKIIETLNSIDLLIISDVTITNLSNSNDIIQELYNKIIIKISKQDLLNNYEDIMIQFGDCVNMIYSEVMMDINQQSSLQKLEIFILLMKSLIEVEKHVILEILSIYDILNQYDSNTLPNCNEGLRYTNLLKQQITLFMDDSNFGSIFLAPNEIIRTVNAFLFGIYNFHQDKLNEGMALIQWANKRRNITCTIPTNLQTRLLSRCLYCFIILSNITSIASDRFYKRTFAIFARKKLINEQDLYNNNTNILKLYDIEKKLLPCKPLLFDLAFIHYNPPNLQSITKFTKGVRNILASLWN